MNDSLDFIRQKSLAAGCAVTADVLMSTKTSFRTGGPADLFIEPHDTAQLSAALRACSQSNTDPVILGNGTNVLAPDDGIKVPVICMSDMDGTVSAGSSMILCKAGASLASLCRKALEFSISGFEFAYGIPGSCGGAAFMNAGAYGGEMKDVILEVNHMDKNGTPGSFSGSELDFSYRHSIYSEKDLVITSVLFKGDNGDPDEIKAKMDSLLERRKEKQPLSFPSAGSTFKRPKDNFAGALIEQCGLKGYSIGGAQVSEKHAGFIINKGGATSADILQLIRYIQKTVSEKTGIDLQPEVKII